MFRHLRALLVSGLLIGFSINMLRYLWYYNIFDIWLIEFFSINFHIVFKVLVTLGIYSLHMIDGYFETIWEKLDDYEFYIKSSGEVVILKPIQNCS